MFIAMFNGWYFFWLALSAGALLGLYFGLRNKSVKLQKGVLFGLLAFGLLLHFLKVYIPPYSVDEARMLRDSWFVNICGANIALFPFFFWSKNDKVKDYMFYIGVLSGLIALFYPQEPIAKTNQAGEQLDMIRFYYHHWMVMAVPLLMVLFGHHKLSYKRIFSAPTGLLLLMLFIMLNQIFQSEMGPGENDAIGSFLALFTPDFFKTVPVGEFAGQIKYWPWFWMIVPVYVLVTPLSFGLCMIFDSKSLSRDVKALKEKRQKAPTH